MSFLNGRRRRRLRPNSRRNSLQMSIDSLEPRCLLAGIPEMILLDTEGDSFPADFALVGDTVFFSAQDEEHGRELWVTDGTAAGTRLVRDIFTGFEASYPGDLTEFAGQLYFTADDGENGRELWMSDGTEAGTVMVRDINSGSDPYNYDVANSSSPSELINIDGTLFFAADDGENGRELWMSDGTTQGTVLLKDVAPGEYDNYYYGSYPFASSPAELTNLNGTLFFTANDGTTGAELWKSDGTASGTVLVRDINPGEGYQYPYGYGPLQSFPGQLTDVDGTLFFTAVDDNGEELWMSDGTEAGTVLVEDLFEGSFTDEYGTYPYSSYPRNLTNVDGTLFFTAVNPDVGEELFRLDNSSGTIELVRDIVPGAESGIFQAELVSSNGMLIFTADDGNNGIELWKSDGTEAGTQLIRDIDPGSAGSDPRYLTDVNGTVYFSADTAPSGRELYSTDGTSSGTIQVADLFAGDADSSPSGFFGFQDTVLFTADDGNVGFQLWTLESELAVSAKLTIFVDGAQVQIPANIGVSNDGTPLSQARTDATGGLILAPIEEEPLEAITLETFFETWRTMAGAAGNNPDATFSSDELLGNPTDANNSIQMFVNGRVSFDFENHVIQNGDEIVLAYGQNPVVSLRTNFGPLLIELFEDETPGTVGNFLNYINDGDYDNSFFHRSANDFVIQSGGFTTPSTSFTSTAQFSSIPTDGQIQNEPGISNLRGTVAMAKLDGDPDSATSQFFINLGDNSSLDLPENNSFTAFGQVLDMSVADAIAALPINRDNARPFNELPVSSSGELAVVQDVDGIGAVSGTKFEDLNTNGLQDSNEPGLAGFTIFLDSNDDGLLNDGEAFAVTDTDGSYRLEAATGDYVLRSTVTDNRIQTFPIATEGYSITVEIGREFDNLDFGEAELPAPTSVDLLADSDTGIADDDDITQLSNSSAQTALQFRVTGVASTAEVRLFASGVLVGTATATSNEVLITTDGTTTFPNGMQDFTATQIFRGVQSAATDPLAVTIDNRAPEEISTASPEFADVDQPFVFDVNSPDEGQAGILYSLVDAPDGMTIDNDGIIRWTPNSEQARPHDFQIALTDAAGNQATQSVEMTVLGELPAFPDAYSTTEDQTLTRDAASGLFANDGDDTTGWIAQLVDQAENGIATVNDDGSFTYVPNANFFGTDEFTYTASNGQAQANVARVRVEVAAINDAPVGREDGYPLNEDTTLSTTAADGVLANDADVDNDGLTASLATDVSHGTLSLNMDGSFTYLPDQDFFGSDSFSYLVSDGIDESGPITVMLTVAEIDDPPLTTADTYLVDEDERITIDAAHGVLSNDTDADSDQLTATVRSQPANGSVTLQPDGSFEYIPNANFFGTDSFTYAASDGSSEIIETVSVQVTAVADPPTASEDDFTAGNDGTVLTLDVLDNDSSAPDGTQALSLAEVTQGSQGGQVKIVADMIEYVAPMGFVGTETFTYTLQDTDGLTDVTTVTIEVTESGSNSLAGSVFFDVDRDGQRDSDEPGVPGSLITLVGENLSGESVTRTAITRDDGSYSFEELPAGTYQVTQSQPTALRDGPERFNFAGAVVNDDQVTNIVLSGGQDVGGLTFAETALNSQYLTLSWFFSSSARKNVFREVVAMGEERAGNATLAKSIRASALTLPQDGNRAPVAISDQYDTGVGESIVISASAGVLANDVDADGDPINVAVESDPQHGELTLNGDGSFEYVPDSGFEGSDSFQYTASDGQDRSTPVTVTIIVQERVNEFAVDENSPAGTVVGAVSRSAELSGSVIFEFEDSDRLQELNLVADDHLTGDTSAPMLLIEYLDYQCPICRTYHPIVEDLEDEFEDDLLVVTRHLPLNSVHPNAFEAALAAEAAGRQGAFDAMGDLLFENQEVWASLGDPISVFESFAVTLGLNLDQFNSDFTDPDLADRVNRDLDAATALNATGTPTFYLNGERLDNLPDDFDEFQDLIEEELDDFDQTFLLDRESGELILTGSNPPNFENRPEISLRVRITDETGQTSVADVTVNVVDVNEAPLAFADIYDVDEGMLLTIEVATGLLSNDSDVDQDDLTASISDDVSNGQLTLQSDGSFFYTPDSGFTGTDSFSYVASDGQLSSNTATVVINVNAVGGEGEAEQDVLSSGLTGQDVVDLALADEDDWLG